MPPIFAVHSGRLGRLLLSSLVMRWQKMASTVCSPAMRENDLLYDDLVQEFYGLDAKTLGPRLCVNQEEWQDASLDKSQWIRGRSNVRTEHASRSYASFWSDLLGGCTT